MKIVTWNCNGALRKKFEHLYDFGADLHIIQECEDPKEVKHEGYRQWAQNHLWIGDTKNRGLGIFAAKDIDLTCLAWTNIFQDHSVKHFLPCSVNGEFDLLAVWTHHNNSPNFGYMGQFWKYLQINKSNFNNILIAGDFNSNVLWDQWDRWWNHSDVVKELAEIEIKSLYHIYTGEEQGKESQPTFYMNRNPHRPYHIDYFFGSKKICDQLRKLCVGEFEKWIRISDHLPMVCEF
jgi:exonuclease III